VSGPVSAPLPDVKGKSHKDKSGKSKDKSKKKSSASSSQLPRATRPVDGDDGDDDAHEDVDIHVDDNDDDDDGDDEQTRKQKRVNKLLTESIAPAIPSARHGKHAAGAGGGRGGGDGDDDSESSLDAEEKATVEEAKLTRVKSMVSRSIGLSEFNPSRGSIMLKAQHMGSLLALQAQQAAAQEAAVAAPSVSLDKRGLKMQRRGSATASDLPMPASGESEPSLPATNKPSSAAPPTPRSALYTSETERGADVATRAGLTALVKLMEAKKPYTKDKATLAVTALSLSDSNTVSVEKFGFRALFKLAKSKKPDVQLTALWSLVTILGIAFSGEDDETQRRFASEGGLHLALDLLESEHFETPMAAAALLGNVVLFGESRDKLIKLDGLEKLMAVATGDNLQLSRTVLVAVANLLSEEDNVPAVRGAGGFEWLLRMAKLDDGPSVQAAVAGLANIANSQYQDEIVKADVLSIVLPLLASGDAITVRAAAQTLANLSQIEANRAALMERALKPLLGLSGSRDVRVQHCTAVALNNLAQDDASRQRIIDAGGEPCVKRLMFSVDADVRSESELLFKALTAHAKAPPTGAAAASAAAAPASPASPRSITPVGVGGVAAFNKKKQDRMDRVSSKRFVLGIYEQYKTQRKAGAVVDPVDVLLAKLADHLKGLLPTPDVVVATIKQVETQAAKNPHNDKLLREMGGIQMLVSHIFEFDTHAEIVNQTLSTLHVLVRLNPRNILAVADVDIAVEEFIKCLDNRELPKMDVINLIGALGDVEKTRDELVTRGLVPRCVKLLTDPSTPLDVQGSTLEVLTKLATEKLETQVAIEQQALPIIFELLSGTQSTDVACQVLRLLAALSFNNRRLQELIRKENKIQVIIGYFRSKNALVQEYAVRALLTFIANDHKNKETARKFDAVPALAELLRSDVDMVVKSAVRGISELSLGEPKCKADFRKAEVLPRLVNLVDASLADAAAAAAPDAPQRELPEMVDCTRSTYVLECLSVLCMSDSQNQIAFASCFGALEKLRKLLDSSDLREVYHAANLMGAACKNNKKVKRALLDVAPTTLQVLERLCAYAEPKIAQLAAAVLKQLK
jgi:hypothetical protein